MKLGERIKQARTKAKLSQLALAHAMGFAGDDAGATICKWENGEREPRFANLAKLAETLKVQITYFVK